MKKKKALKANLAAGYWEANTQKETPTFETYTRYKFLYVERYNPDVFCKEPNYNICCQKDEKVGGGWLFVSWVAIQLLESNY